MPRDLLTPTSMTSGGRLRRMQSTRGTRHFARDAPGFAIGLNAVARHAELPVGLPGGLIARAAALSLALKDVNGTAADARPHSRGGSTVTR